MELKQIGSKLQSIFSKYRYAIIVLIFGIILLLIPGKTENKKQNENLTVRETEALAIETDKLENILQSIDGAGKVQVMLSFASSEQTKYITNSDTSDSSTKLEPVIITDENRNEAGLIEQINPPKYRGAVIVCQGADSAQVRLAITQAVSKITGLSSDNICVLKMK